MESTISRMMLPPPSHVYISLIWYAIERSNDVVIKYLKDKGAKADFVDSRKQSLLHLTAEMGDVNTVSHVLDMRADVNAQDLAGDTALHVAARLNHAPIVELLVSHGADANILNTNKTTCLHEAAFRGDHKMVRWLMYKGAFTNRFSISSYSNSRRFPIQYICYTACGWGLSSFMTMRVSVRMLIIMWR